MQKVVDRVPSSRRTGVVHFGQELPQRHHRLLPADQRGAPRVLGGDRSAGQRILATGMHRILLSLRKY